MFEGFSPETFDFLWGIRMNNDREWFLAHKQQYLTTLYQPMKELGQELFQPFLSKPGSLLKVSRIYRDARLHHPLPYKESLWICIRRDTEWWATDPCLYFEVNPVGANYGFSLWQPKVTTMERFRRQIQESPDAFLSLITKAEEATGTPITAALYKRPKQTDDPRLAPYFAWKSGIGCAREEAPGDSLFTPELSSRVRAYFEALIPVYDYFCMLCQD